MIEPIVEHDIGDVYIGSTCQDLLCQRFREHKRKSQIKARKQSSYILFEKYGVKNCRIILIENVNAESKDELISREAFHIRNTPCINKQIPGRKNAEWIKDNKEATMKQRKEYREKNKEIISDKKKITYLANKEVILAKAKKYRIEHKDAVNAKERKHRNNNKDAINARNRLNAKNKKLALLSKDAEQDLGTIVSQSNVERLDNILSNSISV